MNDAVSFIGNVTKHGARRKHIELQKEVVEFIPLGAYQVTISALGTISPIYGEKTE